MTCGAWQVDPRTLWLQNASSFSCPGSFLLSSVSRRGWETGKVKGTGSRLACACTRLMLQARSPCLAFTRLPHFHGCWNVGQERAVGWGCQARACITATSESMGLDWQGPGQYQKLENALQSKSIELIDGELLI